MELFPSVSFDHTVEAPMCTLKSWSLKENIYAIDMLWLDMQGYEVNALKGAGDLLKSVKVIYTELCTDELYQGLTKSSEYISFLNANNFELIYRTHENQSISEGIFVNKGGVLAS